MITRGKLIFKLQIVFLCWLIPLLAAEFRRPELRRVQDTSVLDEGISSTGAPGNAKSRFASSKVIGPDDESFVTLIMDFNLIF